MKILMLTPSFPPSIGGVQTHVRRVCEELAARGHQATVVCRRENPSWPETEEVGGIEVVRVPARGGRVAAWRAVKRRLRDADVVQCHDAYAFFRYYLPFRLLAPGRPVFITFHGYEGWPVRRGARMLRRMANRLCAGSICVGEFVRKWYGTACDAVTYGGVDAVESAAPKDDAAVFVGRLDYDTGVMEYLEAMRTLRDECGHSVPLHICGDGPLRAEVAKTVRVLNLEAEYHGMVPDPEAYLRRGRFALVSGYLSMLTAMALGRRVLALYETPIKKDYLECFPGAQYAVVSEYPSAVANAIAEDLSHPQQAAEQIAAARQFARAQTWGQVAAMYLDLWSSKGVG